MNVSHVQTDSELTECLAVRRRVFIDEQQVPEALEVDELDSVDAAVHLRVTNAEGDTIGTGRLKRYDAHTMKVQRVAIDQPYRKEGAGRSLMAFAESWMTDHGFTRAILDAQLTAEGFYQKLGYVRVNDNIFLDADILHVAMEKQLIRV